MVRSGWVSVFGDHRPYIRRNDSLFDLIGTFSHLNLGGQSTYFSVFMLDFNLSIKIGAFFNISFVL